MGVEDDYLRELQRRREHYRQKLEETIVEIDRRRRSLEEVGELPAEERRKRIRSGFWAAPVIAAAAAWVKDRRIQSIAAAGFTVALLLAQPWSDGDTPELPALPQRVEPYVPQPSPEPTPTLTGTAEPTEAPTDGDDGDEPPPDGDGVATPVDDEEPTAPESEPTDDTTQGQPEPPSVDEPTSEPTTPAPTPTPSLEPPEPPEPPEDERKARDICVNLDSRPVADLGVCIRKLLGLL